MFTGLIETTGTIVSLTPTGGALRLIIAAPQLAGRWRTGDSIAVNGVCLTALPSDDPTHFAADLAQETIDRTTLSRLAPGATVNLELPTPSGAPLGGHVVQGHVDTIGNLLSLVPLHSDEATTDWRLTIELPESLLPFVVQQGSLTVDGISLTVARLSGNLVEIAIIPHTYAATHLHTLAPGAEVNLEADVLSRYAAQQHRTTSGFLTIDYLLANGY